MHASWCPLLTTPDREEKMKITQDAIERNVALMVLLTLLVVSVGGLVEIVPLFFQKSTTNR
jgi:cbb3-type cytochrome oxidase cytochrome c subunit